MSENDWMPVWTADGHQYLSTSCLHADRDNRPELHEHCAGGVGTCGEKHPARCKWCEARCICACHRGGGGETP